MKIIDLIEPLELKVHTSDLSLEAEVSSVFVGDLLSYVMGEANSQDVWVTVQAHMNVIAVALLKELSGIIICGKFELEQEFIEKANEENLALLQSSLSAYEICKRLVKVGL